MRSGTARPDHLNSLVLPSPRVVAVVNLLETALPQIIADIEHLQRSALNSVALPTPHRGLNLALYAY